MRLLINERDPLVRRWLGVRAEEIGVELVFAGTTRELFEAIDDAPPDCVVMDASSSTDEADPLWQQLRQSPERAHIPILLYSSSARWQTVAELAGATVDGFIPRPFTPEAVVSAAQQATQRRPAC